MGQLDKVLEFYLKVMYCVYMFVCMCVLFCVTQALVYKDMVGHLDKVLEVYVEGLILCVYVCMHVCVILCNV